MKDMIKSVIEASLVNKTELSEALGFDSRGTLYNRFDAPEKFTIGETEILAKYLKLPLNDVTAILLGNREAYYKTINKLILKSNGKQRD